MTGRHPAAVPAMHDLKMEDKSAGNTVPRSCCTTTGAYPWEGRHATWVVLAVALLLRFGIGLHSYSGAHSPPRYGDYEAQRHWMEITLHTPISAWYVNTTDNNLDYWGLDYPPLTAYQSWLYGKAIQQLEPEAVALGTSRGYETESSKTLLRWSVVASDLFVLFPAMLACMRVFYGAAISEQRTWMLFAALLQPAALLIDHGHFQYNGISLGLAAGAAAAIGSGRDALGTMLFCLSVNHKQMAMYYAPAFFCHLLGNCLQRGTLVSKVAAVARLGVVVIATFALVWAPFLASPGGALAVLQRLAPLKRGLYEDYVANFWCATSPLIKWKRLFSREVLVRFCMGLTLASAAPALLQQLRHPSKKGLLFCMASSALSFFLFSYQVHEKSILLPLMPLTLLAPDLPVLAAWMPAMAAFSMFPLLKKDSLVVAYLGALLFWASVAWPRSTGGSDSGPKKDWRGQALAVLVAILCAAAFLLHAAVLMVSPPPRLPYLYDALIIAFCFVHFLCAAVYVQWRTWTCL